MDRKIVNPCDNCEHFNDVNEEVCLTCPCMLCQATSCEGCKRRNDK